MPEGDTIHRAANRLREALVGDVITRYWAYQPQLLQPRRDGRAVTSVEARGKNLLIHFDDDRALYSHMRMTGSWHVYAPDERWRRDEGLARVVIENPKRVAVCFAAPVIELLTEPEVRRHRTLSTLGPDLLAETFDVPDAIARLRVRDEEAIGEVVMDQRVLAGIGNVYKSEVLFLTRLDPFAPVRAASDGALTKLVDKARSLMQANLTTRHRITRRSVGSDVWVYERRGQRCFQCGAKIQMRRQGDLGRSTYFCPRCQRVR